MKSQIMSFKCYGCGWLFIRVMLNFEDRIKISARDSSFCAIPIWCSFDNDSTDPRAIPMISRRSSFLFKTETYPFGGLLQMLGCCQMLKISSTSAERMNKRAIIHAITQTRLCNIKQLLTIEAVDMM